MLFDKTLMFLDNEAYNATPKVVDLGAAHDRHFQGEPLKISLTCANADLAGATGVIVKSGPVDPPANSEMTAHFTAAQMNAGVSFTVTPDMQIEQFMTIELDGTPSAGTGITAGILFDAQTNR